MNRLLEWRNDVETRRASLNDTEIPLDEHACWLAAQLASPDVALYIIEAGPDCVPCGQVRLNRLPGGGALVSIGLAGNRRRQGLGTAALRAVQERGRPAWATPLYAVIRLDNVTSRRAFEAAGFRGPSDAGDRVGPAQPGTGIWVVESGA